LKTMIDRQLENKLGFDAVRTCIADRCATEYAVARTSSEEFSTDPVVIRRRLSLAGEMKLVLMFEENFPTAGYIDALPFLEILKDEGAGIDLLSMGKLRTTLDTSRKVSHFFQEIRDDIYPQLSRLSRGVVFFPEVQRRIDTIIDKFGEIRDNASPALQDIRRSIRDKENSISRRASAILKAAQEEGIADPEMGVSIRDGKYLIPVNTSSKRRLSGFVYDQSASGKTTFVEPSEIIDLENEICELRFAESREIAKILFEFSEFLRPYVPELIKGARTLGELDFIMAKARVATDYAAGMPIISESGELLLRKARHPLLEKTLRAEGREMVPQTLTLTPKKHILLISGPNAGGKSVCLKTTGLLQYMFQWGMLIPSAETSELPVFDRIMVSIGDNQSIDNDLSTYSSFLLDMRTVLKDADSRTLVLIDEFGSGTEPAAGGAIAESILSELDSRGVYGVITTHYTNLKLYASSAETGVSNGAMMFDSARITPLFKLEMGLPGNSFAFELARKMGLPENIVKNAEERVGDEYVGIERNLRKIARNRRALDERLQKIKKADKSLDMLSERYESELSTLRSERQEILDEARKEAQEIVRGANKAVEKTIRDIRESQASKDETRAARAELQQFVSALVTEKTAVQRRRDQYLDAKMGVMRKKARGGAAPVRDVAKEPLKVGEKVKIVSNGMVGEVTSVSGKYAFVTVGQFSSKQPVSSLERISSNEYKAAVKDVATAPRRKVDPAIEARRLNFKTEIDLRGERLGEALDQVMHYVDDAIMVGVPSVRIIHGKGTGVLRDEIQKYLHTVPGVTSAKDEDIQLGGTGVTIVRFD